MFSYIQHRRYRKPRYKYCKHCNVKISPLQIWLHSRFYNVCAKCEDIEIKFRELSRKNE